jgi:putative flippase GtrA
MTSLAELNPLASRPESDRLTLDVTIPVFNEEADLAPCVRRLHAHLERYFPYQFLITIADNASTDSTPLVAARLSRELPGVRHIRLEQRGRGRALSAVWLASRADVVAYMDVDLSTDLNALLPLVAPLISGHSDVAIGSRLSRHSRVVRGTRRELISRCYNLILRSTLLTRFSDAQCGFKAVRADVARRLLPLVQDTSWFFDTELLVLAERSGLRIHEVPVDWVDDPDSRVDILSTALADLRGVARLGRALATGALPLAEIRAQFGRQPLATAGAPGLLRQLVRFGAVGVVSTLAYLLLFWFGRGPLGSQLANLVALLVTAVANTAVNRRFTFGITGQAGAGRHQAQGLVVFGLGLALTSGALGLLHAVSPVPHPGLELTVLVLANLAATVLRFVLLRGWVFGRDIEPRSGAGRRSAPRRRRTAHR